jgi:hypothetical protein
LQFRPNEKVEIGKDVQGWFRMTWADGKVLVSNQGYVTAIGEITESNLSGFWEALPDHVMSCLIVPDDPEARAVPDYNQDDGTDKKMPTSDPWVDLGM